MRQTTISRSVVRLFSADMPIGDPFGAGKPNDPISLIAGVASVVGGMEVIAGVGAMSELLGGLMIAGGVMTGLGAITGNKTLSKLGMVASLAGGVGQFLNTGGFSAYSEAFEKGGISGVYDKFTGAAPSPVGGMPGAASAPGGLMGPPAPAAGGVGGVGGIPEINIPEPVAVAPTMGSAPAAAPAAGGASSGGGVFAGVQKGIAGLGDYTKLGLLNMAGSGLAGMSQANTQEAQLAQNQPLIDARVSQSNAETALLNKKTAGPGAAPVGAFAANTDAAVYGRDASGKPLTQADYIRLAMRATQPAQATVA